MEYDILEIRKDVPMTTTEQNKTKQQGWNKAIDNDQRK
jgi:hypothetical protein